jgi:hypothetical protein
LIPRAERGCGEILQFYTRLTNSWDCGAGGAGGEASGTSAGCPECQRLWREYGAATTAHIRLQGRLQVATLQYDLESIEPLKAEVEAAAQARTGLREAIRRHIAASHAGGPAA